MSTVLFDNQWTQLNALEFYALWYLHISTANLFFFFFPFSDNVHFQNSAQIAKALVNAQVDFQAMVNNRLFFNFEQRFTALSISLSDMLTLFVDVFKNPVQQDLAILLHFLLFTNHLFFKGFACSSPQNSFCILTELLNYLV